MTCYFPLRGYWSKLPGVNGKRRVVFNPSDGYMDRPVTVPCGQCYGCRLDRSKQWALRCMHEASLHDKNCFVTLTYDDDHLPFDSGLRKKDFQDFVKRLRRKRDERFRYFHCGEYGEKNLRPHYHALFFGLDFPDSVPVALGSGSGANLRGSAELLETWGLGLAVIGDVTFESCAYVARYCLKKVSGNPDRAKNITDEQREKYVCNYSRVDPNTGQMYQVIPEYTTMSRGKGIGKGWIEKYKDETYRDDYVIMQGRKVRPPRYYDSFVEERQLAAVKAQRRARAQERAENNTAERLAVRCEVAERRGKFFKRSIEE